MEGRWMEGKKGGRNKDFPFWYFFFALLVVIFLSFLSGCVSGNLGIRVSQDLGGFIKQNHINIDQLEGGEEGFYE